MQTQWYGDKRDVVKWATLVHMCTEHKLKGVIQVPFRNDAEFDHALSIDGRPHKFPKVVWRHFRDLQHIEGLGQRADLQIHIVRDQFRHDQRDAYVEKVCRTVAKFAHCPKVVILDPDTGIAPKTAGVRHVRVEEIKKLWRHLKNGDWLVLYQHASRSKGWRSAHRRKFASACGGASVRTYDCKTIAHDVVFFCAGKNSQID
jgi:hypothetical protein